MLTTFLLSSAFVAGQAAPAAPAAQLPPVVKMTAPMAPEAPAAAPAEEPKADEPPPATKYFLEKLLAGSSAGAMLEEKGIKIYGWTSGNYTASSASKTNAPTTFNDAANTGQMNQNWLEVSKAIDTSKKENQWGFRYAAILPGTDARFTIARGLGNPNSDYPIDPMVAGYVEYFMPNFLGQGTTLRIGKWDTHCSYEVMETVLSPFVTKSYNFQYNPFTHTGVQATTILNDNWTVMYGVVTGSDVFIDPAGTTTFIGQLRYAPKDSKSTLTFNTVVNDANFNTAENFANYDVFNVIYTRNLNDRLQYVLDATYSFCNNTPVGNADWYGFANYFIRKHCNPKLVSTLRLEIFEDSQGFRTGTAGTYYEATYGVAYTPKDWLIVRPFARYDYNKNGAFESGDKNLYTGGIELIARW